MTFDPTSPTVVAARAPAVRPADEPAPSRAPSASAGPAASRFQPGERDTGPTGSVARVDPLQPRPAAGRRPAPAAGRGGHRVPGLAARTARSDQRRRGVRHGDPHRVAVRVRASAAGDRLRVRDVARRDPAGCLGRSCRWWPGPRSSRPTPGRSSARTDWPACGQLSDVSGSRLLRLAFRRKERRRRR